MTTIGTKKKVFVAMSGGVDSSVAAALLKEQGYEVTGVFMKNWSDQDFGIKGDCPWQADQQDVADVCEVLGIPFMTWNFEKEYRARVIEYFFREYKAGRTPNPDVLCNKEIKFGIFLERALKEGADLIATGHYAQVRLGDHGEYELLKGLDQNKDQSYFLCELTQEQLAKTLFPIGALEKPAVRAIAEKFKLPVAKKPDSQGICFVGEINVAKFLRENIAVHTGEIIDADSGLVVGKHDGIEFYTIGQREGLNIGGAKEPYFVCGKDKESNILFVAMGKSNLRLYRSRVKFENIHWIVNPINYDFTALTAVIRYRQTPAEGMLYLQNNCFDFVKTQRAVAEGQIIAFYKGNSLLGSAVIINE